jgi:uncharacterized linocin/CFP29 family protein
MDHLRRELAPISATAWEQLDATAARALRHFLAARALVDFVGPLGWEHAGEPVGRTRPALPTVTDGVLTDVRGVQPLVELRVHFEVALGELDAVDRGAPDPDLTPLLDAARRAALAEDKAVFHGFEPGAIRGIAASSPHEPLAIDDDYEQYPATVARAATVLRRAGVDGPYAIALGPRCYTGVIETTEHGGYPLLEHLRLILGGPVVWAPAVDGAVVLSVRGGDYELVCGQDFSLGYRAHREDALELYLEETMTLRVHDDRAAVPLRYPD